MTRTSEDDSQPFDHDAYVRSRLPDFVLAGMGLKAASTPVPTSPPPAEVAQPRASSPTTSGNTHTRVGRPAAKPAQKPSTSTGTTPALRPREEPEPPSPAPHRTRDERLTQLAKQTVTAVLALPVWLIVLLLVFGVLHGSPEPSTVTVNDDPSCASGPIELPVADLGTARYWEAC